MDFLRKYIFVILTVAGVLFLVTQAVTFKVSTLSGVLGTNSVRTFGGDYRSYYFASKHLLAGDDIYFANQQKTKFIQEPVNSFVYPPLMSVFFVPLSFVQLTNSYIIFTIFSVVLFLWSIYVLSRVLPNKDSFFWLSILAFFSSPILVLHFDRGQTDIIILFLLVVSFSYFVRKKGVLSGILIGLAASLKLTPLIFLPFFFIKERKAFWAAVITIVGISACFNVQVWGNFLKRLGEFSGEVSSGNLSNSLYGVFYNNYIFEHYSQGAVALAYLCLTVLILSATFYFIYKNKESNKFILLEYGIMAIFMMILPSVAWIYNGVHSLIVLAAYWSVRFNRSLNKWAYFFFDMFVYVLLSQPIMSPLVRNSPIYHIFSLRPLIYLCFVALFVYLIHKEKIDEYIIKLKLTKLYSNSFIRFCVVGLGGAVTNLLIFYFFSKISNINIAAVGAFIFAVTQNYLLNHSWSFGLHKISKPNIKSYFRYIFVNLFGLVLNLLVLNTLVKAGFNALFAQAVGIIAGMLLNYAGSYLFVFSKKTGVKKFILRLD